MTVCTSHDAFLDLGVQCRDRRRAANQYAERRSLRTGHVVKLENYRIGKSAVHAWMNRQVLIDEFSIASAIANRVRVRSSMNRLRSVAFVIFGAIYRLARLAHRMRFSDCLFRKPKLSVDFVSPQRPHRFITISVQARNVSIMAPLETWRARRESNPHRSA